MRFDRGYGLLAVVGRALAALLLSLLGCPAALAVEQSLVSAGGDEAESEGPLRRFAGSMAIFDVAEGIDPTNPYAALTLSLLPRLRVNDRLTVLSRFDLARELTWDDVNNLDHELVVSDLYLDFRVLAWRSSSLGLTVLPALRWYLPTSENSRLSGLVSGARVGVLTQWSHGGWDARPLLTIAADNRGHDLCLTAFIQQARQKGKEAFRPR